ncbi:aldehyde dehydrogenase family protein [Mycobacterium sp. pUA109]|uniref:aldehyde dehydrogenase family protein n=1 Tax=Mycobacterium sp. pUA109 TaxID=3238982 RepID=UPI00351BC52D
MRRVFATGRTRPLDWRLTQLRGIERFVDEREPEIAAALAEDLGRSPAEAWLGDVASTKAEAVYARKHVRKWMRGQRQSLPLAQLPGRAWVQYDPLGVVLVIGPWNYPLYLSLAPLVAAVAAGNCAVVKPSELAPATSALLARLLPQYVDPHAVRVVEGDAAVTQDLLAAGFDHALFTGGTEIGKKIMAAAAPTLTPVTLELGGKSPVIVAADADIDVAARRIAWVKLLNSGQTCIAPDYVLADHRIVDALVGKIVANLRDFRSGEADPKLPIVNQRQFDRLVSLINATDGRVVTGGRSDTVTLRIEPTVIVDPPPTDPVMADELFGPLLPIVTVESVNHAVQFVNSRPKPLALYVFTSSGPRGRDLVNRIPSGGAVINHVAMHCLVPSLPFGGVGASGMGAYHGRWGFETLSHRRAVLAKTAKPDPKLLYPPYTQRALNIMRRLF